MVTLIRPSHEVTACPVRRAAGAVLALVAGFAACTSAFAQFTPPGDSRYYTPPVADMPNDAATDGSLLSYRRDDAAAPGVAAAAEPPPRLTASPPLVGDVNPLRKAPEPQAPAPLSSAVALPAAPTAEPMAAQPSSEISSSTEPSSMQAVTSDPFPEAPLSTSTPLPAPAAAEAILPPMRYDAAVELASLESVEVTKPAATPLVSATPPTVDAARLLAPPKVLTPDSATGTGEPKNGSLPFTFSKLESFSTAGAGLAIVIGLFLICVWMLRRGGAKTSGVLPADAFAVLGRAPLTSQSFAHLLRLGNKLVLVAMSPDGIQPLTEVTDPMEVDRLTGLCASGRGHGPSAEFQQVLSQLSREPARGFLGGEAKDGRRR
jgi:flagellar biogenesis protein FliO